MNIPSRQLALLSSLDAGGTGLHRTEPSPARDAGPSYSPIAAALLAQRDAIAAARKRALLREDCRAAKVMADEARALTHRILKGGNA